MSRAAATNDRRMLLVHAHPDDETTSTGATMARYAAQGAAVTLLTCTLGELGEVLVPELAELAADRGDQLGGYRIGELAAAMIELGVTDHRFLGGPGRFRDSGMMGEPGNPGPTRVLAGRHRSSGDGGGRRGRRRRDPGGPAPGGHHLRRERGLRPPGPHHGPPGGDGRHRRRGRCRRRRRAVDGTQGVLDGDSVLGPAAGHRRGQGGRGVVLRRQQRPGRGSPDRLPGRSGAHGYRRPQLRGRQDRGHAGPTPARSPPTARSSR